jgi:hypothetical protein
LEEFLLNRDVLPVRERVAFLRSFDSDRINCFSCGWPVLGRVKLEIEVGVSDVVEDRSLVDSLKNERLCDIGDTGLLKASTESCRDNWSVELVLELEREVVCLDAESGREYRPLLSDSVRLRESETCSRGSIIRACWILTLPGHKGQRVSIVRNRDFSCNCFR